jgi:NAD(P)-dependent dehydrogenase (short-subunit alcohol dehydrogenase family)
VLIERGIGQTLQKEIPMRFQDKSVIITVGGGKIGKAYAIGFAKEGAKVIAGYRQRGSRRESDSRHGWYGDQYGL